MEIDEINNILAKRVTGEASLEDLAILDQWKTLSIENEIIYNEYALLWDIASDFEPTDFNPDFEAALESHLNIITEEETKIIPLNSTDKHKISVKTESTSILSIKRMSAIAAVFVVGFAAMFLLNNSTTKLKSDSGVQYVSLDDGSKVWLDKGASISFNNGFGSDHRDVVLEGKAFFDVTRNESLPFNIVEEDFNVSVLGTSFTIDGANDQVSVTSGKVAVNTVVNKMVLTKNQKASVRENIIEKSSVSAESPNWRNINLSFDNAPLSQVIADINMYHNNQLALSDDSKIADCVFTSGGLRTETLENIILILQKSFDLSISSNDNGITSLLISDCY